MPYLQIIAMANKKNSKKKGRRILPYEKYRIKNLGNKKVTEDRIQMPPLSNIPPADFSLLISLFLHFVTLVVRHNRFSI